MNIQLMVDEITDATMANVRKMKKKELLDFIAEMLFDNLLNMSDAAITDVYKEMKESV
jgi:hypothetical protein